MNKINLLKRQNDIDAEVIFTELICKDMVEEMNNNFMDMVFFNRKECRHCSKNIKEWKKSSKTETVFTQSTSMGGNEETYEITYEIIACPYCDYMYNKKEIYRKFIDKGWVGFVSIEKNNE